MVGVGFSVRWHLTFRWTDAAAAWFGSTEASARARVWDQRGDFHLSSDATTMLRSDYMTSVQRHGITPMHRAILVRWLSEVRDEYGLTPETIFTAVQMTDMYLSCKSLPARHQLQLLGIAAMLLSDKFHNDTSAFNVHEAVYISANLYTPGQIDDMEHDIARTVDYDLLAPTVHDLLIGNPKAIALAECALAEYKLLAYTQSEGAEACARIANGACVTDRTDLETLIINSFITG
jgi:hypothetical protein